MKIYKKGSSTIITDLSMPELAQILKIQVPLQIVFINNKEILKKINIGERLVHANKQKIVCNNTITRYDVLFEEIGEGLQLDGAKLSVVLKLNDFRTQETLFKIVGKIKNEIFENCVFYQNLLGMDAVLIENKPLANNDSDKIYFFNKNATILSFSANGPEIFTESVKVNNITDFMCE